MTRSRKSISGSGESHLRQALEHLLLLAEQPGDVVLGMSELRQMDAAAVAQLKEWGLIVEAGYADSVWSEECDERCVATPEIRSNPTDGEAVGVYHCKRDGCGMITFSMDELRLWRFDTDALALQLAASMKPNALAEICVPDRLWYLGTAQRGRIVSDIFLGRGMTWPDALAIQSAKRLQASPDAVILTCHNLPPMETWKEMKPVVMDLGRILSSNENGLRVNVDELAYRRCIPHPDAKHPDWISITDAAQELVNRRIYEEKKIGTAKTRLSRAADDDEIESNGLSGSLRLLYRPSFNVFRQKLIDADVADAEAGH